MDGLDAFPDQAAASREDRVSLHVLAYNLKRAMQIVGVVPLMQAMRA
jgi:hypothetical protein